jgi:TonB family protein
MRGLYLMFALLPVRAAAQNPEYTAEARLAGLEGTVQITGTIAADGTPSNLHVTKPLGLGLDEKAFAAVAQQRFTQGAHPGPAMPLDVDFLLPDKHSRWHLTGVTFEPPEGASRPVFLSTKYPLGSGITIGADDSAIDEARIVAAVGRQAWAVLSFDVDENGIPVNFEVPDASVDLWRNQAIALVRDWRFTPGRKDGKAIAVRCTLNVVWGDRNLSASQLATARPEETPLRPAPEPTIESVSNLAPPITFFEFPPTPGAARIKLAPSEAAERLMHSVAPEYPSAAKQAGMGGVVLFNVLIGTDGHVRQAVAVNRTSSYIPEASQAVLQWEYRPLLVNGNPAEVTTVVPVEVPLK